MCTRVIDMVALPETSKKPSIKVQQPTSFLQEIFEGLQDGILILTTSGNLVHANSSAHKICTQIRQQNDDEKMLSSAIWSLCESVIENRTLFPNQNIIISDEIEITNLARYRVRVRWINLNNQVKNNTEYLLVTLENRYETLKNMALAEAKKYELTPRETEIWHLYRANYSYKEIADQLYITINTVKKHMKNIHVKRQPFIDIQ